jgi:hypothetical protein
MAISIVSPRFSFVQFAESDQVESCQFNDIHLCLPVYEPDDVHFQFILQADTEAEADALCDLGNDLLTIGLTRSCAEENIITFAQKAERYRISTTQVLYLWAHGLTDFDTVIDRGECFLISIAVDISAYEQYEFCSNCFQRISDPCHTSVIEFGNEENSFGFNYCYSEGEDTEEVSCEPTFIQFINESTLVIPYTAALQAKYGVMPSVKVWMYDTNGELVNMQIRTAFDTYPPTELRFDFGGPGSGVIKIS